MRTQSCGCMHAWVHSMRQFLRCHTHSVPVPARLASAQPEPESCWPDRHRTVGCAPRARLQRRPRSWPPACSTPTVWSRRRAERLKLKGRVCLACVHTDVRRLGEILHLGAPPHLKRHSDGTCGATNTSAAPAAFLAFSPGSSLRSALKPKRPISFDLQAVYTCCVCSAVDTARHQWASTSTSKPAGRLSG